MLRLTMMSSAMLLLACRPQGLPELPEDRDPAAAGAQSARAPTEPALTQSAFSGVELGKGGHHHGHGGHGGQGKEAPPEGEIAPDDAHADHGGQR